jgi:hypothetical protein
LSFKTLSALQWALNHRNSDFVMKTDDDAALNIPQIMNSLPQFPSSDFWMGMRRDTWYADSDPDLQYPWSLTDSETPKNWDSNFLWTNGFGYMLSRDLVQQVDNVLKTENETWPQLHLEDINSAMLLNRRLGVAPHSSEEFDLRAENHCYDCPSLSIAHSCFLELMFHCDAEMRRS